MRPQIFESLSISLPEKVVYMVAILGMVGDQLSTRIGLSRSCIYESNPNASWLITNGLWLPFDLLVLLAIVGFTALFVRSCRAEDRRVILGFPLIFGGIKLLATFMNLLLNFSV